MTAVVSNASGLIALLQEPDEALKQRALEKLNHVVPEFWFQISDSLATLEELFENKKFGGANLAALVASKVRGAGRARRRGSVSLGCVSGGSPTGRVGVAPTPPLLPLPPPFSFLFPPHFGPHHPHTVWGWSLNSNGQR
jgi:hypothetical protein